MNTTTTIGSCDTKYREIVYTREQVKSQGMETVVINVATNPNPSYGYDVSGEDVTKAAGTEWTELEPRTKNEKITFMIEAMASYVGKPYVEGEIDGILSAGGLQNTAMTTSTMRRLSIGFPKVMATTATLGRKTFENVTGAKSIVTVPPVYNPTGLSTVTRQIMADTRAYCVGMVRHAGQVLKKGDKPVVGMTLVGIANTGACVAIGELERLDIEPIGSHSAGAGGAVIEQMAADGLTDGILDLATHEITQEYSKGDFSYGEDTKYRLVRGVEKKVPLVVSAGDLDLIGSQAEEFPPRMGERIYMMHNANTAHIKLLPDEAEITTARFAVRIERIGYSVKFLIPTDGTCYSTRRGEVPYYKEVDGIIIHQLKGIRSPNVEIITIPGNLDTEEWGIQAAYHVVDELKEHAVIDDEMQY